MEKISAFGNKALQSLRNNDFSPEAAIAEAIDNSIEAKAKNIFVRIDRSTPPGRKKPIPHTIGIGDDGHGMDAKTLQYCLRAGFSGHYNSRTGIGRFGVGMTFGAIRVCQFVEVYSRQKQGNWLCTHLDIEDRPDNLDPGIAPTTRKEIPKEFRGLVGDVGTLVVWKKIDRIESDFDVDELVHWLGRVYRKFIGDKIINKFKVVKNPNKINIIVIADGKQEKVTAFDPLYVIPNPKRPSDEVAELKEAEDFTAPVHEVDAPMNGAKTGKITIRMSLTPKSWRPEPGSGRSHENNQRYIFENEGFSFLRNGREVFYGTIPGFKPATVEHDRFWSCEIDFEPVLDHQFSVKNIKIGARPLPELKEELEKKIGQVVREFRKEIEKWEGRKDDKGELVDEHGIIREKASKISKPLDTSLTDEEKEREGKKLAESHELQKDEEQEFLKLLLDPNTTYITREDKNGRPDGPFIEIVSRLGKKVVFYNVNHAFFKSVYGKINELKEIADKLDPEAKRVMDIANDLKKIDLDQLIFAFADTIYETQGKYKTDEQVVQMFEEFVYDISRQLRRAYRTEST